MTSLSSGAGVPIADALSRVSPQLVSPNQLAQHDAHHVTKTIPTTAARLQQIREETANEASPE